MSDLSPVEARVGTTIAGSWRIDSLIGVGGSSAVYAATHSSGRRAAFKILHDWLTDHEESRKRFLEEQELASVIDHPDRVSVQGLATTDDGALVLVMELLEGETLAACWQRTGVLPPRYLFSIASPLLDQLAACHRLGIVHRDLKPENIFLGCDGRIRLLDFGVARGHRAITNRRVAMGTPTFMPPEQARGERERVDARSDVFAVGAMLWSILSGFPFRRAATLDEVVRCAAYEPVRSLSLVAPELPRAVIEIVDRALQLEREQRWQCALDMKAAIDAALETLPEDPIITPLPAGDRPTIPATPTSLRAGA